jgi:hypothetical protein
LRTNKYVPAEADTYLIAYALAGSCGEKANFELESGTESGEDTRDARCNALEAADGAESYDSAQQSVFDEILT